MEGFPLSMYPQIPHSIKTERAVNFRIVDGPLFMVIYLAKRYYPFGENGRVTVTIDSPEAGSNFQARTRP